MATIKEMRVSGDQPGQRARVVRRMRMGEGLDARVACGSAIKQELLGHGPELSGGGEGPVNTLHSRSWLLAAAFQGGLAGMLRD